MARIRFREKDGTIREGSATTGSAMQLALAIGVRGIEGQCGGSISCGTCHVHVPQDWIDRTGQASAAEADMLEFEPGFGPTSRLSCQIAITPALDGLTLDVATGEAP
jgi:2Fe-2S ferredoxin